MNKIIITGNPVDGFNYYGPFDEEELTLAYDSFDGDWWVASLKKLDDVCYVCNSDADYECAPLANNLPTDGIIGGQVEVVYGKPVCNKHLSFIIRKNMLIRNRHTGEHLFMN
jgi:hypothetical protein